MPLVQYIVSRCFISGICKTKIEPVSCDIIITRTSCRLNIIILYIVMARGGLQLVSTTAVTRSSRGGDGW